MKLIYGSSVKKRINSLLAVSFALVHLQFSSILGLFLEFINHLVYRIRCKIII